MTPQFLREQGAQNIEVGVCPGNGYPAYNFDLYIEDGAHEQLDILRALRIMLFAQGCDIDQLSGLRVTLPAGPVGV